MARWLAILVGVLTLSALSGVGAYQLVRPALDRGNAQWQEIAWPYPRDAWPAGRAFRCASCGEGGEAVELYMRPKIGFCNCDTGVADDDEVERVADLDLITQKFLPPGDRHVRQRRRSRRPRTQLSAENARRLRPCRRRHRAVPPLRSPRRGGAGPRQRSRPQARRAGLSGVKQDPPLDAGVARRAWGDRQA